MQGPRHETDLSAISDAPQAHAWFSRAHADPRRARGAARAPGEGACTAERLNAGGSLAAAGLPRSARLRRPEHFAAALAHGASGARRHFTLFANPNGLEQARIGIIAAKKVAPRAVDRNRVKRMVREAFRSIRPELGGLDVVVRLRRCPARGGGRLARSELSRLFAELASRARGTER